VSEGDPADSPKRNYAGDRLGHEREQASGPSVEEQWIVAFDQELIEGEAARRCLRDAG
jgi:hypothetical protein